MFEFCKKLVAVANFSGAMEAETIQKNAVSQKNLRSRVNVLSIISCCLIAVIFSSCATYHQKLKSDFVGFSDNVTTSYSYTNKCLFKKLRKQSEPFNLFSEYKNKQEDPMYKSVYGLKQGFHTASFYALDVALDRIEYVQKTKKIMEHDPNAQYYVFMLTDGLDDYSGSLVKQNNNWKYRGQEVPVIQKNYGDYLQERMNNLMKKYSFFNLIKKPSTTNKFKSYVLLYKGKDIKESPLTEEDLKTLLMPFCASQNVPINEKPTPIIDENFEGLLEKLSDELVSNTFAFGISKGLEGQKVKMILNGIKNEDVNNLSKQISITGDFILSNGSYQLTNIQYSNGLTTESKATTIRGVSKGNDVVFSLDNLKLNDKKFKVPLKKVLQYNERIKGKLIFNSEFVPKNYSEKNTYFIVILDGSESFKEKFKDAQNTIMEIVKMAKEL